jgi:hypothetical protein
MAHSMWVGQLIWRGVCALTTPGGAGATPVADGPCGLPILRSIPHDRRLNGERWLCDVCHARRSSD